METSVETTIEKIRHHEQDMEAKLIEKRQFEGTVISVNQAIRDATLQAEKANKDILELDNITNKLKIQIDDNNLHRKALMAQVDTSRKELSDLRAQADLGVSTVWGLRSSLCETVHNIANECDVWALLTKPTCSEAPTRQLKKRCGDNDNAVIKERLKLAIERRDKALAERDCLLSEPETGVEFIRIKNALSYSERMIENMHEGFNITKKK